MALLPRYDKNGLPKCYFQFCHKIRAVHKTAN